MRVLDVLHDALGADEGGAAVAALQFHVEALRVLFEGGALQERARAVLEVNVTTVKVKLIRSAYFFYHVLSISERL